MKMFRPAKPASFAWNYTKTLIQTVLFWITFLAVLPLAVLWIEESLGIEAFNANKMIGIALFAAGGTLGISSSMFMTRFGKGTPLPTDCPRKLVIVGPYAYVRNPMALGGITQGIAVGVMFGSWFIVGYALAGIPVWHFVARPWEEADMRARFEEEFDLYCENVRLWIPRITPYRNRETEPR